MPKIIKEGYVFGGGNVVDTALDATSTNPVENKAVANQLSANDNIFKAAYQNGKYGFTIDGNFYEIGGGGMIMDTANKVALTTTATPAPADGCVIVSGSYVGDVFLLDGVSYDIGGNQYMRETVQINGIKSGDTVAVGGNATGYFYPYI